MAGMKKMKAARDVKISQWQHPAKNVLSIEWGGFMAMHGTGKYTFPEQLANEQLSNRNDSCTYCI